MTKNTIFNKLKEQAQGWILKQSQRDILQKQIDQFWVDKVRTGLQNMALPKPNGATKDSPIVTKWIKAIETRNENTPPTVIESQTATAPIWWVDDKWEIDIKTTKIWEVLTNVEKWELIDAERNRIRWIAWISFDEKNKQYQQLQKDIRSWKFFGWATEAEILANQADSDRARAGEQTKNIEEQARKATTTAEDVFRADLIRETTRIKEAGQRVMDTTQRLNSLRGGGRSSANEADIQKQQSQINDLINVSEQRSDLALEKRRLEIEWASADVIASINNKLASSESILNQRIAEATAKQKELDANLWATSIDSANGIKDILDTAWIDTNEINLDKTQEAGLNYFLKSNWELWINPKTWKPEVFKRNEFWQDIKISSFKDANDNTYVYTNGQLDSIILNDGQILKWDQLQTIKVPKQVKEDKSIQQKRTFETQLRKEFNNSKQFVSFLKTKEFYDRSKLAANAETWPWDVALMFNFMKMLDPTSVVNPWEQATIINAWWVWEKFRGLYNKVLEWDQFTPEVRRQMVDIVNWAWNKRKGDFTEFKNDFEKNVVLKNWADPESIFLWLDVLDEWTKYSTEQEDILNQKFNKWETKQEVTPTEFTAPSWKTFNIPEETGLTSPDKTGWTNNIPTTWFTEKINVVRTWTNVAKDTNNPWNITADSIPTWISKEEYGKKIGATWTYLSPNGREYFVFPTVESWTWALRSDIMAKISGRSRNIKPTDTLARFQRVYVWETSPNYLAVLKRITWANENTPIKDIDPSLLTQAVMKAEWFSS